MKKNDRSASPAQISDEQSVKQKYPDSYTYKWGGWRDGEQGWNVRRDDRNERDILGCGQTESEAWSDARSRLEPVEAPKDDKYTLDDAFAAAAYELQRVGEIEPVEAVSTTPKVHHLGFDVRKDNYTEEGQDYYVAEDVQPYLPKVSTPLSQQEEPATPDEFSEPPREEGRHRFMAGTCVDCGHPLDEACSANLQLQTISPKQKIDCCLGAAPAHECYINCGGTKLNPIAPLLEQEEPSPKEREFCEWMIGFNSDPKFVQKFTTLFIDACNERVAKGGYPLHAKPSPAPLPGVELPQLDDECMRLLAELNPKSWADEGWKIRYVLACRERQLKQSRSSLTQALTYLAAAKIEIDLDTTERRLRNKLKEAVADKEAMERSCESLRISLEASHEQTVKFIGLRELAESKLSEAQKLADAEEIAFLRTIDERDQAEEALSQAYYLIKGESPEWSNLFGCKECLEEIDDAQQTLRKSLSEALQTIEELRGGK